MKKFLFFISVCLIFFLACNRCEENSYPKHVDYIEPTADDLAWISFNDGDTIIFQSNTGILDTFIRNVSSGTSGTEVGNNYNSCETIRSPKFKTMTYNLTYYNDSDLYSMKVFSPNTNGFNYSPKLSPRNFMAPSEIFVSGITTQVIISGQTYNDVYVIYGDSTLTGYGNTFRMYYQKENGLLGFDQLGGIKWERIN